MTKREEADVEDSEAGMHRGVQGSVYQAWKRGGAPNCKRVGSLLAEPCLAWSGLPKGQEFVVSARRYAGACNLARSISTAEFRQQTAVQHGGT